MPGCGELPAGLRAVFLHSGDGLLVEGPWGAWWCAVSRGRHLRSGCAHSMTFSTGMKRKTKALEILEPQHRSLSCHGANGPVGQAPAVGACKSWNVLPIAFELLNHFALVWEGSWYYIMECSFSLFPSFPSQIS